MKYSNLIKNLTLFLALTSGLSLASCGIDNGPSLLSSPSTDGGTPPSVGPYPPVDNAPLAPGTGMLAAPLALSAYQLFVDNYAETGFNVFEYNRKYWMVYVSPGYDIYNFTKLNPTGLDATYNGTGYKQLVGTNSADNFTGMGTVSATATKRIFECNNKIYALVTDISLTPSPTQPAVEYWKLNLENGSGANINANFSGTDFPNVPTEIRKLACEGDYLYLSAIHTGPDSSALIVINTTTDNIMQRTTGGDGDTSGINLGFLVPTVLIYNDNNATYLYTSSGSYFSLNMDEPGDSISFTNLGARANFFTPMGGFPKVKLVNGNIYMLTQDYNETGPTLNLYKNTFANFQTELQANTLDVTKIRTLTLPTSQAWRLTTPESNFCITDSGKYIGFFDYISNAGTYITASAIFDVSTDSTFQIASNYTLKEYSYSQGALDHYSGRQKNALLCVGNDILFVYKDPSDQYVFDRYRYSN